MRAGERCPVSGATLRSPVVQPADARGLGTGPLYPITLYTDIVASQHLSQMTPGPSGLYDLKVVWASTTGHRGPAVVRAGRVDGAGRAVITLQYDPAASRGDAVVFDLTGAPADFPSATSVSGPGCYAYQIDGVGLEEVIVFRVPA